MVSAVVLNVEVTIERLSECNLGQPPLVALLLVTQLMRRVDAEAADEADGDRETDLVQDR